MAQSEQEMQTRGRGVRPTAMNVLSGEDNYERWQTFREAYNDYARWEGVYAMEPELQLSNFRQCFGEANRALLRHLGLEAMVSGDRANPNGKEPCTTVKNFVAALETRFGKKDNLLYKRYLFHKAVQKDTEKISDFADRLRGLARNCRYNDLREEMVRDRLVIGTRIQKAREAIFKENNDLTLENALDLMRRHEDNEGALADIKDNRESVMSGSQEINAVSFRNSRKDREQTRVVETLEEGDDWCEDMFMAGTTDRVKRKFFTKLQLEDKTYLRGQIDTGATCNAMSWKDYSDLKKKGVVSDIDKKRRKPLKMYDNHVTMSLGVCRLPCSVNGRSFSLPFQIRGEDSTSSGGGKALLDTYADIFEGLGEFGDPVKLQVDPLYEPRQQPPRRIAIALLEKVTRKIEQLVKAGIIQKVTHPTPWISNLVAVPKNDDVRLTLDPTFLNRALRRPKFPMPTLQDQLPHFKNARFFTIVDAKDGFYQMRLTPESQDLTTFWGPKGRYRYIRVPQGISSAPEEYQRRQMEAYEGLDGVMTKRPENHDKNVKALFERIRQVGLKLNKKKIQWKKQEVKYMGHLISRDGVRPDPGKVEAIRDMKAPDNPKAVLKVFG
ncbi:uncharacterized protein LOC108865022, partial [Galendromus occidentalis]|uniref:Uncharacterized protein LOC108865022 n=1 Tax=Galendromus occidentalis TaxID=34638 RepID=A0AAJ7L7C1_9ACAR